MTPWAVAWQGYLSMGLYPWDSPSKNTGVGCCALLQGIFPTQGFNPGLLGLLYLQEVGSLPLVAQLVKNPPAMWETWDLPWVGKIPWRREGLPTPIFLPGELHGQRSLEGYRPWDCKESDTTDRLALTTYV